jgi:hypothetical protein
MAFHSWESTVGYAAGGKRSLHILLLTFPFNKPKVG